MWETKLKIFYKNSFLNANIVLKMYNVVHYKMIISLYLFFLPITLFSVSGILSTTQTRQLCLREFEVESSSFQSGYRLEHATWSFHYCADSRTAAFPLIKFCFILGSIGLREITLLRSSWIMSFHLELPLFSLKRIPSSHLPPRPHLLRSTVHKLASFVSSFLFILHANTNYSIDHILFNLFFNIGLYEV